MIKKIIEIKNLGIFQHYRWNRSIPEFARFNIVYGWNGSGKTTLSQLFSSFNSGELKEFPNLKYKIETEEGEYTNKRPYNKQIRVFNRHYISENIDVLAGKANPIYILGEKNKKLAEQIRNDEKTLRGDPEQPDVLGKIQELDTKTRKLDDRQSEKGALFTSVAKSIKINTSGAPTRNYRKNNAEDDYKSLNSPQLLSDEEIKQYLATLEQQEKETQNELDSSHIKKEATQIVDDATLLMERTVETAVIEKLKNNPSISTWVEDGYKLHKENEFADCQFCNQHLPKKRIEDIAGHFNDADKKLKDDIDNLVVRTDELRSLIENLAAIDRANLYAELQEEYLSKIAEFNRAKQNLLSDIQKFKQKLENKKLHTTNSLKLTRDFDTNEIVGVTDEINTIIKQHNKKSNNFNEAKKNAGIELKKHYLSERYDDVEKLKTEIAEISEEVDLLQNGDPHNPDDVGIIKIQKRIKENKKRISTAGIACDEINAKLKTFLGRKELVFDVEENGYSLKRNGKTAKNLSEGEKTAIAFVYFIISLKDQDFNSNTGIVVIDDPISSLDSNSLFQAFAVLKNAVQDISQVFIFTHNFDFLQLLLNWLKGDGSVKKKYFMIKSQNDDEAREATLDTLDKLLIEYSSEYQYLFKILYNFPSDGTIVSVYNIPNIARKVLEYFLMIMVPDNSNPFIKLKEIEFDKDKKTAIYKFTNDQSHMTGKGFNPSLVPEAQNTVTYLLEMIDYAFPKHYQILEKSINNDQT